MKHKRNDPMCDHWDSQGDEKDAVSISIAFCIDFLIRNENITSDECKTKKPFAIVFYVGRVTNLPSWVAKKSCYCQTLINECSIFDYPSNFEDFS